MQTVIRQLEILLSLNPSVIQTNATHAWPGWPDFYDLVRGTIPLVRGGGDCREALEDIAEHVYWMMPHHKFLIKTYAILMGVWPSA